MLPGCHARRGSVNDHCGQTAWPSGRGRRRYRRWDSWLILSGWLLFTWFLLWQATVAPTLVWQDSRVYEAIGSLPVWSGEFWFNQRPPLTPLLWRLTGSPAGFVIGQTLIASASWGFLTLTIGRNVARGWRRVMACFIVLAFATTLPITQWNRSLLSETLAISALAVLFGIAIRLASAPSVRRVAALIGCCMWIVLARDSGITLSLMLAAGAIFLFMRSHKRNRMMLPGVMMLSGVAVVGLVLVASFSIAGVLDSGRSIPNIEDVLYVRIFPYPARVAWFAAHGMPEAKRIDQLARSQRASATSAAPVVVPDLTSPKFLSLDHWLAQRSSGTYSLWLATHPLYVLSEPLIRPERAYNFANGDLLFYAASNRVTSGLGPILWPPWPWIILFGVGAIRATYVRDLWKDKTLQMVALLAVLGVPVMAVAWHSDGQEVTRHTLEGLVQLRLGVLLSLIISSSRASTRVGNVEEPGHGLSGGAGLLVMGGQRGERLAAPER